MERKTRRKLGGGGGETEAGGGGQRAWGKGNWMSETVLNRDG